MERAALRSSYMRRWMRLTREKPRLVTSSRPAQYTNIAASRMAMARVAARASELEVEEGTDLVCS